MYQSLRKTQTFNDDNSDSNEDHGQQEGDSVDCNPSFEAICSPFEHHLLTKGDLKDNVLDLNLSNKQAELLGSKLKGRNLSDQDTEISFFRNRQNEFTEFFSQENDLVFCTDVYSITGALGN